MSAKVAGETLGISVPTVVEGLLGTSALATQNARLAGWAQRIVRHAAVRLDIRGKVPSDQAFVVMSNHQSHFDVPLLYAALGSNLRMVAKRELFRIPIFGRALHDAGFVEVDRKNRASAIENLNRARDTLGRGVNIWIAPEGTRSKDGTLGRFKKGGFILAQSAGCPILPVSVSGTRDILPSGSLRTKPGVSVRIVIHDPIDTRPRPGEDETKTRERLVKAVRAVIEEGLRTGIPVEAHP